MPLTFPQSIALIVPGGFHMDNRLLPATTIVFQCMGQRCQTSSDISNECGGIQFQGTEPNHIQQQEFDVGMREKCLRVGSEIRQARADANH